MKRTSKYLGKKFGDWTCDYVGVATVQAKKKMNGKGESKRPGHCNYYYCFSRITSDSKCLKKVRLTSAQAAAVYRGKLTVEEVANKKIKAKSTMFAGKIDYEFI